MQRIQEQRQLLAEKSSKKQAGILVETSSDESSLLSNSTASSRSQTPVPPTYSHTDQPHCSILAHDQSSLSSGGMSVSVVQQQQQQHLQMSTNMPRKIKRIMMSSHNVSSVNEFVATAITVNENRRIVGSTRAYSIDLSHASKDPMLAGPRDLLTKDVKKTK